MENHTFFFYGTLMDPVILNRVTGVYFQTSKLHAGILKDFKRVLVKKCNYPAILESEGDEVEGIVVHNITPDAAVRLDEFENNYERKNVVVKLLDGSTVKAAVYVAGSEMLLDDIAWSYNSWYHLHRRNFLNSLTS